MKQIAAVFSILAILFALPTVALAGPPAKGDLVLAQWGPDNLFYPARIAKVDGDKMKVAYYDGDVATVRKDQVKAFDWKAGTVVQCNWKNGGQYFPGKIASVEGEALQIHYDDGDKEEAGIGRCRSK